MPGAAPSSILTGILCRLAATICHINHRILIVIDGVLAACERSFLSIECGAASEIRTINGAIAIIVFSIETLSIFPLPAISGVYTSHVAREIKGWVIFGIGIDSIAAFRVSGDHLPTQTHYSFHHEEENCEEEKENPRLKIQAILEKKDLKPKKEDGCRHCVFLSLYTLFQFFFQCRYVSPQMRQMVGVLARGHHSEG